MMDIMQSIDTLETFEEYDEPLEGDDENVLGDRRPLTRCNAKRSLNCKENDKGRLESSAAALVQIAAYRIDLNPKKLRQVLDRMEDECIKEDWQLKYMDSCNWKTIGAPVGLITSVRHCLQEKDDQSSPSVSLSNSPSVAPECCDCCHHSTASISTEDADNTTNHHDEDENEHAHVPPPKKEVIISGMISPAPTRPVLTNPAMNTSKRYSMDTVRSGEEHVPKTTSTTTAQLLNTAPRRPPSLATRQSMPARYVRATPNINQSARDLSGFSTLFGSGEERPNPLASPGLPPCAPNVPNRRATMLVDEDLFDKLSGLDLDASYSTLVVRENLKKPKSMRPPPCPQRRGSVATALNGSPAVPRRRQSLMNDAMQWDSLGTNLSMTSDGSLVLRSMSSFNLFGGSFRQLEEEKNASSSSPNPLDSFADDREGNSNDDEQKEEFSKDNYDYDDNNNNNSQPRVSLKTVCHSNKEKEENEESQEESTDVPPFTTIVSA